MVNFSQAGCEYYTFLQTFADYTSFSCIWRPQGAHFCRYLGTPVRVGTIDGVYGCFSIASGAVSQDLSDLYHLFDGWSGTIARVGMHIHA